MRPLHLADIEMAARVLALVHPDQRQKVAETMVAMAQIADAYRCASGLPHPKFGTGTLMSAATQWPAAPRPASLEYEALDVLFTVVGTLRKHHHHTV